MSEPSDGGPGPPQSSGNEEFANFEQTLSEQQKQMSELKEKVLQFEADKREKAASVKLKADECYKKLMNLRSGANKIKLQLQDDESAPEINKSLQESTSSISLSLDTSTTSLKDPGSLNVTNEPSEHDSISERFQSIIPPSEKMMLLKQQTEENRRKMAERIHNQKGIALKVNKLLEQFDNMQPVFNPVVGIAFDPECTDIELMRNKIQSLERTVSQLNTQLQESRQNESISDLLKSNMSYLELQNELNLDDKSMLQHLSNLLVEKDNEKQQLTNQVFDLQENLKEKDSVIDSKTKAITLMSEDLSRKGKNTVDLLEETKLEMVRMQHNFVQIEANLKQEIEELNKDLRYKNNKINELSDQNEKWEQDCNALQEKLLNYGKDITEGSLEKKIQQLEDSNNKLQKENAEMEKTINSLNADIQLMIIQKQSPSKSLKKGNKKGKKGQQQTSEQPQEPSELQNRVQELENQISEYQAYIMVKDEENCKSQEQILVIKTENEEKCKEILCLQESITKLEKEVADPNNKSGDVMKLEQLLDEAKANSKKQLKYLQKQVDSFGKISDAHQEVVNLNQKVFELNHKVAELEEEKGNLQLHLVDYDTNKVPDSEMNSKLSELQSLCQSQMHSIALLESQKFDLVQDLHDARQQISSLEDELADLTQSEENAVSSEITSIQLEEKLDGLTKINQELTQRCEELQNAKISLEVSVEELNKIRNDLTVKLEECLCENEELVKKIDRMERLNAEKVSSAESIEIVENLTQKEKMEIENFQKGLSISEDDNQATLLDEDRGEDVADMVKTVYEMSEDETDLNISVAKLTEESSDLMEKIALFTQERMEVMARLETLQVENQKLLERVSVLEEGTGVNVEEYQNLMKENDRLVKLNEEHGLEKEDLIQKLNQLTLDRNVLQDDVNKLLKEINDTKSDSVQSDSKPSYDSLLEENKNTKQVNEQLNNQIQELSAKFEQVTKKLQNLDEEYNLYKQTTFTRDCEYKDIIYRFEKEQEKYQQEIDELNRTHTNLIQELDHMRSDAEEDRAITADVYKNQVDILNEEIQRLSNLAKSSETVDALQIELDELRTQLEDNKNQCTNYILELKIKDQTINTLNEQIMELYGRVEHLSNENKDMEIEVNNLMEEASVNNRKMDDLFADVSKKDSEIQRLCNDLQAKHNELAAVHDNLKMLQNSQSDNNGKYNELHDAYSKLELKNKENIEKMKKLAANLKKKSSLCTEYETKLNEAQNKCVKIEEEAKQQKCDDTSSLLQNLSLDLQEKTKEILDLNLKLQNLVHVNNELAQRDSDRHEILKKITKLEQSLHDKEIQNDELRDRITEHKFNYETSLEAIKAKLNEKEVYIESLEIENNGNKEKVSKLIDGIASIEERRCMLEERAEVLDAKLSEKSAVCSEFANNEDLLIRRMKALVDEDQMLEKKMRSINDQNEQLNLQIQDLMKQNHDLSLQSQDVDTKIQEYENEIRSLRDTENEYVSLQAQYNQLQNELKRVHVEAKEKEELHQKELDEMENDFSSQLQILENERRNLSESLQKHHDSNDSLQDEIVKLKDTIHQLEQNKTDLERDNTWIKLQNDSMLSVAEEADDLSKNIDEKQDEIRVLREKLEQAESLITAGPVNVDNTVLERLRGEVDDLKRKLVDKDKQIESYQRQNMQLQMAASFGVASEVPFFQSSFSQDDTKSALAEKENIIRDLQEKIRHLEILVTDKSKQAEDLQKLLIEKENESFQRQHVQMQMAANEVPFFQTSFNQDDDLKNTLLEKENLTQELQEKVKNLEIIVSVKSEHMDELQKLIVEKDNEVTVLQNSASSLAMKMEEIIHAYQYLQNEFEKKQQEVNEFIPMQRKQVSALKQVSAAINEPGKDLQNLDLSLRIQELEELLRRAQAEKEEALFRLQQLVYDMDNLKKQQVQFDIESQFDQTEPKNTFKDVVDVSLPVYSEEGKREVVEEVMVCKKTYVCQKDEPFEDESGWGFDMEEPFMEEIHHQHTSALPSSSDLSGKITSMQKQIDDLEAEKLKLSEDFKQQQTKLTKSMMKLKEYKNKNNTLSEELKALKKSSDGLDFAIQEVLALRIEELENLVKENKIEAEKNLAEKKSLNKRIDVLTAANERMVECKEKQDLEVERLNIQIKQLHSQFHWDSENSEKKNKEKETQKESPKRKTSGNKIEEADRLNTVIRELSIDNEELQALLDEQNQSHEDREKKLSTTNIALTAQVDELSEKIQELRKFNQSTQNDEADVLNKNIQFYQEYIQNIIRDNDINSENTNTTDVFVSHLEAIGKFIKSLKDQKQEITETLNRNSVTINDLNQQISDKCAEIQNLQFEVHDNKESLKLEQRYKNEIEDLHKKFSEKCAQNDELQRQSESLNIENQNLQANVNQLQIIIGQNNATIESLHRQVTNRMAQIADVQSDYRELVDSSMNIGVLQEYIDELQSTIEMDKSAINNLNAQLTEKAKLLQETNNTNIKLQKQNDEFQGIIAQNSKTINDLENYLSVSTGQIDQQSLSTVTNNDILNLQQENMNLKQIIEQNKNIVDELNTRLFDTTTQLDRLQYSTKTMPTQNDDTNTIIEQYKNNVDTLNGQLFERTCEIELLQKQLSTNNEEMKKLQSVIDDLKGKLDEKSNLGQGNNTEVQELKIVIENNRCALDNLEASLSEKTSRLDQLQNEYTLAIGESNRLQQHTDELNAALEQNRHLIDSLNTQLAEKSKLIENLEQTKNQEQEEHISQKIAELENNLQACNEQWSQLVEQRCREIAESWKIHLVEVESQFSAQNLSLEQKIKELQDEIERLNSIPKNDDELALLRVAVESKQKDFEYLTKECEDLRLKIELYEMEIGEKNEKIAQLTQELTNAEHKLVDEAANETKKWTDIVNRQHDEYNILKHKFDDLTQKYEGFRIQNQDNSNAKDSECQNLNELLDKKSSELETLTIEIQDLALTLEEERKQMDLMRSALESQEIELVTLKEKVNGSGREIGVAAVEEMPAVVREEVKLQQQPTVSNLQQSANQSELDLALYMLHQRDMRCEELTLEVVSLLEERDTLQLRLSNAIRVNETITGELRDEEVDAGNIEKHESSKTDDLSVSTMVDSSTGATVKKKRDFEMLKHKLSELHALDHARDLRISDDRKLRQQQQMAMVERDYEKLPEEAKQRLIDTDYTLSRDYQSPSTSLLNWLWGKGTRKVEHL